LKGVYIESYLLNINIMIMDVKDLILLDYSILLSMF